MPTCAATPRKRLHHFRAAGARPDEFHLAFRKDRGHPSAPSSAGGGPAIRRCVRRSSAAGSTSPPGHPAWPVEGDFDCGDIRTRSAAAGPGFGNRSLSSPLSTITRTGLCRDQSCAVRPAFLNLRERRLRDPDLRCDRGVIVASHRSAAHSAFTG